MASRTKSEKWRKLESAVLNVQRRWGPLALRKLERPPTRRAVPHIPTGLPALDRVLGIGGIPKGRVTELLGAPTSGKTTLANIIVAHAQQNGSVGAYVDLSQTFDPHYAVKCGIDLHDLLIVQPFSGEEALEMTISLVSSGSVSVLVFDSASDLVAGCTSAQFLSSALSHLAGCTAKSHCALIFLTALTFGGHSSEANYPPGFGLPYYATVRLLVERERWLRQRGDVWGYSARMTVIKNKLAPPGRWALVRFVFNGQVRATSENKH